MMQIPQDTTNTSHNLRIVQQRTVKPQNSFVFRKLEHSHLLHHLGVFAFFGHFCKFQKCSVTREAVISAPWLKAVSAQYPSHPFLGYNPRTRASCLTHSGSTNALCRIHLIKTTQTAHTFFSFAFTTTFSNPPTPHPGK